MDITGPFGPDVSRLLGQDIRPHLHKLGPEFLTSLNLDESILSVSDDHLGVMADFFKFFGGDKVAAKSLRSQFGLTSADISKLRRECPVSADKQMECRSIGSFIAENRTATRNLFISAAIVNKLEELFKQWIATTQLPARFESLPSDLAACLASALECIGFLGCILIQGMIVGVNGETSASAVVFAGLRERFHLALSVLRTSLAAVGAELSAQFDAPVVIGATSYSSAHHATLACAQSARDAMALCEGNAGKMIYLSTDQDSWAAVGSPVAKFVAMSSALTKLQVQKLLSLEAHLEKEASRAAHARSGRTESKPLHNASRFDVHDPHVKQGPHADFQQGVTGLTAKQQQVFSALREMKLPMKGIVLARKLGMAAQTFRTHYAPAFRPHGLTNGGSGYFIKSI